MLGSLEGYIKRRNKTHHTALRVFRSDNPHPQEEVILAILVHICNPRGLPPPSNSHTNIA